MTKLSAFFILIRAGNLIIIMILFQILYLWYSRHFVPMARLHISDLPMLPYSILIMIASAVVLIAAAGYIINDYFDIKTDLLNKPDKMVAGKFFSRKSLIFMNLILSIIGILSGFIAAYGSGHLSLGLVYPSASVLLIFYSTHLKKYPWIGNIFVAFLIGFLPVLFYLHVVSYIHIHSASFSILHLLWMGKLFKFLILYGLFAFLVNMIREIIKDMEDVDGDRATGAQTIPVRYGMDSTKIFVFLINCILFILIAFVLYNTLRRAHSPSQLFLYFLVVHLILCSFQGILILKAKSKNDFHRISQWLKWVMLLGLLMPLVMPLQ